MLTLISASKSNLRDELINIITIRSKENCNKVRSKVVESIRSLNTLPINLLSKISSLVKSLVTDKSEDV